MQHACRYWWRVSGLGQVFYAHVECALGAGRLEFDAAGLVAARSGVRVLAVARLGVPVDPQPAITAPPSTAMAIQSELKREMRIVLMAPCCTPAAVTTG